jgi:3-deoxy-manno-octulosonate cytidylyltransferase (CMP-KDO synthetase)
MNFVLIIPARYKSSRFPGKPLTLLKGKSMIRHVYDQCLKAVPRDSIYVATEDKRIADHCKKNNIQFLMTSDECLTGTDRLCEVSKLVEADYYINIQGDEPLFNPIDIQNLIQELSKQKNLYDVYCGYCSIDSEDTFFSFNMPKVIFNKRKELIYISRAPIPSNKQNEFKKGFRQVCGYAFSKRSLEIFDIKSKTYFESIEDIELLRFLELGVKVKMVEMSKKSIPVDVKEDIEKVLFAIDNVK